MIPMRSPTPLNRKHWNHAHFPDSSRVGDARPERDWGNDSEVRRYGIGGKSVRGSLNGWSKERDSAWVWGLKHTDTEESPADSLRIVFGLDA